MTYLSFFPKEIDLIFKVFNQSFIILKQCIKLIFILVLKITKMYYEILKFVFKFNDSMTLKRLFFLLFYNVLSMFFINSKRIFLPFFILFENINISEVFFFFFKSLNKSMCFFQYMVLTKYEKNVIMTKISISIENILN